MSFSITNKKYSEIRICHIMCQNTLQHNSFEAESTIEKLKTYKSPGTDQIPAA
jgi:hypothetical protein